MGKIATQYQDQCDSLMPVIYYLIIKNILQNIITLFARCRWKKYAALFITVYPERYKVSIVNYGLYILGYW